MNRMKALRSSVTNPVTKRIGRQLLVGKKHSPALLFGAGVAGVVITVVLSCKATLKLEEVVDEAQENLEKAKAQELSETDRQRVLAVTYTKATFEVVKLYGPAVLVGIGSVCALTGSHVILTNRNAGLTAAYVALEQGYQQYRKRVVDELGEEKDREFQYGTIEKEIVEETDEGPVVSRVKMLDPNGVSMYARFFDESNKNWNREGIYNQMFVQAQQNYANDLLKAQGHVFLNEVYDMLGMPRSKEGSVVGWVLGKSKTGDDFIDFGVFANDKYMGQQFVNGNERSVLLDFNVDGVIYDLI